MSFRGKQLGISVFSVEMETVLEVRMSGGREFQRLEADLLRAHDYMMVRLADGAKSWMVEEDRWMWISSARYGGARL